MSISTLSTNTSGAPSLMLFTPRILKDISAPGWPDVPVTCSPGIAPISTLLTEVTGRSPNISSIFTLLTAPVRLAFFVHRIRPLLLLLKFQYLLLKQYLVLFYFRCSFPVRHIQCRKFAMSHRLRHLVQTVRLYL